MISIQGALEKARNRSGGVVMTSEGPAASFFDMTTKRFVYHQATDKNVARILLSELILLAALKDLTGKTEEEILSVIDFSSLRGATTNSHKRLQLALGQLGVSVAAARPGAAWRGL